VTLRSNSSIVPDRRDEPSGVEAFTAADISVTYALEFAQRSGAAALGEAEQAYVARTSGREAYKRAMEVCQATKAWAAEAAVLRKSHRSEA
jgi:hypothetical protein